MRRSFFFLCSLLLFGVILTAPSENSFVVSSTEPANSGVKEDVANSEPQYPRIYEMDITSNISNRFATTLVVSKVKNAENVAKETTFTVVLPDKAFISEFVMEIRGKSYKAYVKEKQEAKEIYDQAVSSGQSAGHVAVSARNSNKFTVSVNVEPESKVVFLLTYEELLERRNGQYELIVNIHPGQIVKDLNVKVQINETRPLKFVRTPSLRSGNEISKNEDKLDPSSNIQIINSTTAVVAFNPDSEKQKQFAHDLGEKESDGLSGQFVVQYDVDRDPHGGEVLLQDGYFVHFFAPRDLKPLPKHVLFVLDSSGSMAGRKTVQVKDAMHSILDEIREQDLISIIDFGSDIYVWDIPKEDRNQFSLNDLDYKEPFTNLSLLNLPSPINATKENLDKAKRVTDKFYSNGGTYMIGGLETALYLAKLVQDNPVEEKYQPIMIFLTDGQPNIGLYSEEEIVKTVTHLNAENNNIPIFSLSFGEGANKDFLKKLSLKNQGFSRHIYEASDASLQLQDFYKQISSPLLSNISFVYNDDVKDVSKAKFPVYFEGSELVVTGRYQVKDSDFRPPEEVSGWHIGGIKRLQPTIETPVSSLERIWAYLTVKQTLDERELTENKEELTKKALDLALKYSFVTDITSLVVVKPNETTAVNAEDASKSFSDDTVRALVFPQSTIASLGYSGSGGSHGLTLFGKRRTSAASRPQPAPVLSFDSAPPQIQIDPVTTPRLPQPSQNDFLSLGSASNSNGTITVAETVAPHQITQPAQDRFPWLASALNSNGTLTIAQKVYELGEAHTVAHPEPCPELSIYHTPSDKCVLLKDCPELSWLVIDFQRYQQYFCPIEEKYAGICCPKSKEIRYSLYD